MFRNNQKYYDGWIFGVDQEMVYRNFGNCGLFGFGFFFWEVQSYDIGFFFKWFYFDYRLVDFWLDYEDRE